MITLLAYCSARKVRYNESNELHSVSIEIFERMIYVWCLLDFENDFFENCCSTIVTRCFNTVFFHFWSISKRRHDSRIVYSVVVSIHFTIITANHKYADNNERAAMRSILFCFLCAFRLLKNFSPWSGSYCCFHFEKAQFQYEKEWRWWTNFLNRADDNTHSQKELFEVFDMYKKQKNNWGKLCRQFILYL